MNPAPPTTAADPVLSAGPAEPRHRSIVRRAIPHLAPILAPRWFMLVVALIASLSAAGFELFKPWPLKFVIDNVIKGVSFLPAWARAPAVDERTWMVIVICLMVLGAAGM